VSALPRRVKGFCCALADRAKTSPIASMRRVIVFQNLIATSQACRGRRRVYGEILPQMRGIGDFRLPIERGGGCRTTSSIDNQQSAMKTWSLGCGYAALCLSGEKIESFHSFKTVYAPPACRGERRSPRCGPNAVRPY